MRYRWPLLLSLAGAAAWTVILVITWASAAPLGHDESQYAIAAREWLAGTEARWFYLSRGMNVVAAPGIWLGESERALRVVPMVVGGLGFAAATWWVAKRAVGATGLAVAGISLLVLAGARNVARYASDLLSDFPAAALLIAALAVIVDEVDREDGPRWRLLAAAPLLAAAMYVRYGSVVPIAVIVIASVIIGARAIARRPWPCVATAGLFLVLLVPHFIEAHTTTGSPLGILLASSSVPQEEYFAAGLVTYVTSDPTKFYGVLIPVPLVAGLVSIGWIARDRRKLLLWLVAVGSLVAIGITTHAQVRYALVSIALLTVLGVERFCIWLAQAPAGAPRRRARNLAAQRTLGGVALAALVVTWAMFVRRQPATDEVRASRMRGTLAAAAAIRTDAHGRRCMVIGYHYTQLEWYSGCVAPLVMEADFVAAGHHAGEIVYVVREPASKLAQPDVRKLPGTPTTILDTPNVVEVIRLTKPGS